MPPPVRSAPPRGEPSLPVVQVSFYRRMKLQRVYPFVVRWKKGSTPLAGQKVTLRLLMAGAQVLPTEQLLDAGKTDATATFYVTPLARGWLRAQRLEIIHDGRKVQEVPLASKATTHRLTWCLLLLTILMPWLVNSVFKHSPFLRESTVQDVNGVKVVKGTQPKEDLVRDVVWAASDNLPDMPDIVSEYFPKLNHELKSYRQSAAITYVDLVFASRGQPYAFYACALFLTLTLISAVMHRDVRRRRLSKPIEMPNAARARMDDVEVAADDD